MISKEQLQRWFSDTGSILGDINRSAARLGTVPEVDDYRRLLRFELVVQLCKLLVRNHQQKRNFHRLINSLKYEKYAPGLKALLKKNRGKKGAYVNKLSLREGIRPLSEALEAERERIHKIHVMRDKFLAHSDPGASMPVISDRDLEILIALANRIHNTLYAGIFGPEAGTK